MTVDSELLTALRSVSTATLTTQLFRRGLRSQFVLGARPLNPDHGGFAGEAFTMRYIPAREDLCTLESLRDQVHNLQWQAVEQAGPGQVLVIDSREDTRAGSLGAILATRLLRRGVAAAVTDGAFRDGPSIAQLPFPAYARSLTASTRLSFFHVADLQTPIGCGGVAVFPGDVVVGDREGIVIIPRHLAAEVTQDAVEQERMEAYLHSRIDGGEPLWGIYPPNERTRAEYQKHVGQ